MVEAGAIERGICCLLFVNTQLELCRLDEMTPTEHEIKSLVVQQIDTIPDIDRRAALVAWL